MIITLTGANDFLRSAELAKLTSDFVAEHGDFALERLDGEEASAEQMRASVESLPFLTPRKLVVLREPSKQKSFTESITNIIAAVAETVDVILVEPKLDKRLTYYKTLKKETDFRDFTELDANGLAKWASAYAKARGGSLSAADARQLIDRLGTNQQMLQNELDKLVAYAPEVTAKTIEMLTDRLPQSTVFELLDAAFGGRTPRALALYAEQRALKVEPQAIIAMLAWQLHILATIKAGGTKRPEDIAKEAKLNPFVVRKSQTLVRNVSFGQLRRMIAELLVLDKRLKREPIDADEALRLYLLRLAG